MARWTATETFVCRGCVTVVQSALTDCRHHDVAIDDCCRHPLHGLAHRVLQAWSFVLDCCWLADFYLPMLVSPSPPPAQRCWSWQSHAGQSFWSADPAGRPAYATSTQSCQSPFLRPHHRPRLRPLKQNEDILKETRSNVTGKIRMYAKGFFTYQF